jgi:transcriptional regulator with XRE-family HTH domain
VSRRKYIMEMGNLKSEKRGETISMVDAVVHRINTLCDKHGYTIYELSKLSGIAQSTLNEIMQGRSERPRIDTITKICLGLGIPVKEFFDDPVFDRIKGVHDDEEQIKIIEERRLQKMKKSEKQSE